MKTIFEVPACCGLLAGDPAINQLRLEKGSVVNETGLCLCQQIRSVLDT